MAGIAELRSLSSPDDWAANHPIRRRVLFESRGLLNVYDPDHPDERRPGNHPKVLVVDDQEGYLPSAGPPKLNNSVTMSKRPGVSAG
jgi:hypothetical protein